MSGWNEGGYEVAQDGPEAPADTPAADTLIPEIPVSVETPPERTPEVAGDVEPPESSVEVAQPEMLVDGAAMEEPTDLPSPDGLAEGPSEAPIEISSGLEDEEEPPFPERLAERLEEDEEAVEEEPDDLPPVGMS